MTPQLSSPLQVKSIILQEAQARAIHWHQIANHMYDGYLPYEFHLRMVIGNYRRFKHLISDVWWHDIIEGACWLHDVMEDVRKTYNDVFQFGPGVAEIVYAVTNEKGKNRHERESDKYFEGIRNTPYATFVKLCDRLANIEYSAMPACKDKGKIKMYRKEHPRFKEQLYEEQYKEMFQAMDVLLREDNQPIQDLDVEKKMRDALTTIMMNTLPRTFEGDKLFKAGVLSNIEMALGKEEFVRQEKLYYSGK